MKCKKCGSDIEQEEMFCKTCGAKIENTEGFNTTEVNENKQDILSNQTNKKAIYSIICSGICYIIFWWLGIVGIILGIQSLNEIKTSNEKGKTIAIAGIVLGAGAIILFVHTYILK